MPFLIERGERDLLARTKMARCPLSCFACLSLHNSATDRERALPAQHRLIPFSFVPSATSQSYLQRGGTRCPPSPRTHRLRRHDRVRDCHPAACRACRRQESASRGARHRLSVRQRLDARGCGWSGEARALACARWADSRLVSLVLHCSVYLISFRRCCPCTAPPR